MPSFVGTTIASGPTVTFFGLGNLRVTLIHQSLFGGLPRFSTTLICWLFLGYILHRFGQVSSLCLKWRFSCGPFQQSGWPRRLQLATFFGRRGSFFTKLSVFKFGVSAPVVTTWGTLFPSDKNFILLLALSQSALILFKVSLIPWCMWGQCSPSPAPGQ